MLGDLRGEDFLVFSEPAPDIDPGVNGFHGGPARRWNNVEAKDLHCE